MYLGESNVKHNVAHIHYSTSVSMCLTKRIENHAIGCSERRCTKTPVLSNTVQNISFTDISKLNYAKQGNTEMKTQKRSKKNYITN